MPSFQPADPDFAARVRASFGRQGFMATLGAELTVVEPGHCEIRLPFREGLGQQHGFFHAGAVAAIADSAGGYAAYTLMEAGDSVLTVEYKINLLAPGKGEEVVARARVVRSGRTLTVSQVDVFALQDGAETLCATLQQTLIRLAGREWAYSPFPPGECEATRRSAASAIDSKAHGASPARSPSLPRRRRRSPGLPDG